MYQTVEINGKLMEIRVYENKKLVQKFLRKEVIDIDQVWRIISTGKDLKKRIVDEKKP